MRYVRRIKHLPVEILMAVAQNPRQKSPAVLFGHIVYHRNGLVERIGGPAVIAPNWTKWYCEMGILRRRNGAAYIRRDGHQEW